MSDFEAMRQLANQLIETADELEAKAGEKEALKVACVPDSFNDFASFFQSDFQWEVIGLQNKLCGQLSCGQLRGLPLTEAAKKCTDYLITDDTPAGLYDLIRKTTGIREFYRDTTSDSDFIYFSIFDGLKGLKGILEALPSLKLVVSKEGREIIEQWVLNENDRLNEERKDLVEKQEVFRQIGLLDSEDSH